MQVKTNLKATGMKLNHNQSGLRVKSAVRAAGMKLNHSETLTAGRTV
jgi:hypothetical protein